MKRHPALQDLSRDHHLVLFHCQRLRRALDGAAPWPQLQGLLEKFLAFYESDMKPHFQEEDELVVPLAQGAGDERLREIGAKILQEHHEFRKRLDALGKLRPTESRARALLAELEPRITRHVRQEEAELFQGVQSRLSEERLQELWRRSYAFRRKNRSPAACGIRP